MKARMIKSITMLGIGAMICGLAAATPALADGRRGDNCNRPEIRVDRDRFVGHDKDRNDWNNKDRRDDHGRFDRR